MKGKKNIILISLSIVLVIFCILASIHIFKFKKSYKEEEHPIIEYNDTSRMRYIAIPMLEEYLKQYSTTFGEENKSDIKMGYYTYKNSQLIAGDEETFSVATIFQVSPNNSNDIGGLRDWGVYGDDGLVHCNWTLIIRKVGENQYRLIDVRDTKNVISELGIEENTNIMENVASVSGCNYKIENDKVYVTYNLGEEWIETPLTLSEYKEYLANSSSIYELQEGSYYISPERTAFIYKNGKILLSEDKGKTWENVSIPYGVVSSRRNFIGFTEDGFGYAIIAGDRTMSWESVNIWTSKDGGFNWESKGELNKTGGSSLATGISYATENIGFISTRTGLYRTLDGGASWDSIEVDVPVDLKMYYDTPEAPIFKNGKGELYVGQGDDGDYGAGKNQFSKFVSDDNGMTWNYTGEVIR